MIEPADLSGERKRIIREVAERDESERPVGARRAFAGGVMRMVADAGDMVRESLSQPETVQEFTEAIKRGVRVRDRTCMRLMGQILNLANAEKQLVVMVMNDLGVSGFEELQRLVQEHRDAEGVTAGDRFRVCLEYCELYLAANEGERAGAVRRLGGIPRGTMIGAAEVVG